MQVCALGYVVARAKDLDDWGHFGPDLLGLQRVDVPGSVPGWRPVLNNKHERSAQ